MATYAPMVYIGDGSTTNFALTWTYLDTADVSAFVNGVSTAFSFVSTSLIKITPAPASGATVRIERHTKDDARNVVFPNGNALTGQQLNKSADQLFYIAQEASADADEALHRNSADVYDAQAKRMVNLANPTGAQDAATKGYVDGFMTTSVANAAASAAGALSSKQAADADAAAAHTDRLAADADVVATHADVVLTHADAVKTAADRVQTGNDVTSTSTNKTAAANSASASETSRQASVAAQAAAEASRDTTLGYKNDAAGSATTATAQAGIATTKANEAATSASNALTHENNAKGYADAAAASAGSTTPVASQINAASDTAFADADMLTARQTSSGNLIKRSWSNLKTAIWNAFGALTGAGPVKSVPVDADIIAIGDSAASSATKQTNALGFYTYIKSKLDSVYLSLTGGTVTGFLTVKGGLTVWLPGSASPLNIKSDSATYRAWLLFYQGTANQAQIGVLEDTNLHVGVNDDSGTYHDAISIQRTTGVVNIPVGLYEANQRVFSPNNPQLSGAGTKVGDLLFANTQAGPTYPLNYGSTVAGSALKPTSNSSTQNTTMTGTWICLGYAAQGQDTQFQKVLN